MARSFMSGVVLGWWMPWAAAQRQLYASVTLAGGAENTAFGTTVAIVDLNMDGLPELIIGTLDNNLL